jgi:hypothetical protein
MRPLTPQRARQERRYRVLRVAWLRTHRECGRCSQRASEVHHMAGRDGYRLLETSKWIALCHSCHQWVTEHPTQAVDQGFSLRRHCLPYLACCVTDNLFGDIPCDLAPDHDGLHSWEPEVDIW